MRKGRVFRERKFNFSLEFPMFGPSVLIRPRSKVVLRCKGYVVRAMRRHRFCGVSTTPEGRSFLLLDLIPFFKNLVNDLDCMRP